MIEHIVLLKLKEGVAEFQMQALLDGLIDLQNKGTIPGIQAVTGGYNNSPEGKSQGYDWGFTIQFSNVEARDTYLPHPDHRALSQTLISPFVEDVLVFDYAHE